MYNFFFISSSDLMPRNITAATDEIKHVNLVPVYGLNVYSMLKHSTLVLTRSAVDEIEDKILYHLHRPDIRSKLEKFKVSQQ